MNYNEYACPCGGRTERRKVSLENVGFWKSKYIFTYYYHCLHCGVDSKEYQEDITKQVMND